jgi:hypothetical protein
MLALMLMLSEMLLYLDLNFGNGTHSSFIV